MDIDRLRYFSLIAETGSIRRAAELLRLSPPALSKALKLLEREVGMKLVVQSGRGILVTDQGKLLASKARKLLNEIEALRELAPAPTLSEQPLRLGSFEVFTTYFLGALIDRHLDAGSVVVYELVPGHLEKALIDRNIDVGITYIPYPSAELEQLRVAPIEMGIFARKGRFARDEDARKIPFVVPALPIGGAPDRIRGSDGWPDGAFPRQVRYQVTLLESAMELCRLGKAAAYIPKFVARLHNERVKADYQLSELPFPEGVPRGDPQWVYLMKRKADVEDHSFRKFAKALRVECARGLK